MARLINIVLSTLCVYLFGAYLRAKQCQRDWESSLPLKTHFWKQREATWDLEKKTQKLNNAGTTSVVAVTTTIPEISTTKNYQVARESSLTIVRTIEDEAQMVGATIPATTNFINPEETPKCFRAFGKNWR